MSEYKYYSTQRPVSLGTYPKDGFIDFTNYDSRQNVPNIGRMAWGELSYDRPLSKNELSQYDLAEEQKSLTIKEPIKDFFDDKDKQLSGEEISIYLAQIRGSNFVDRTVLEGVVKEFENNNILPNNMGVFDENGRYEDKEFLYSGYDTYVALSHLDELYKYRGYFTVMDYNFRQRTDYTPSPSQLNKLAEVYYAKVNGLNDEQIKLIIGNGERDSYDMRELRKSLENGVPYEQVAYISTIESPYSKNYISEFLEDGGDFQKAKVFLPKSDMTTVYFVLGAFKKDSLTIEQAKGIVEAKVYFKEWLDKDYDKQRLIDKKTASYTFSPYDLENYVETFIELAKKGATYEDITTIAKDFVNPVVTKDLKAFADDYFKYKPKVLSADEKIANLEATIKKQNKMLNNIREFLNGNPEIKKKAQEFMTEREKPIEAIKKTKPIKQFHLDR